MCIYIHIHMRIYNYIVLQTILLNCAAITKTNTQTRKYCNNGVPNTNTGLNMYCRQYIDANVLSQVAIHFYFY